MQSIEEKIYEVFWDKNIARMINRADLFSFLKQYVNPGLLTRSSKSELVHDLKEYMTTANLEFIAERMESFGLPMVDTVSVLDTTSYAVKKLVDNDTLRIVGTFKGGNQRIPYKLCSVLDILDISHAGLLEKKQQPVLPATDENIASALYTINKSAKVSRDTKNRSYYNRKFQCCGAAKTRMLNLYHLKDAVLKKLQEEDRVEYLGVNRQVFDYGPDSFLRLYRIGDFTFHIPCQKDEVNELEILDEEIDGEISAEKTRNVDINFRQAMLLLENYSGVKAAGTYNKNRDMERQNEFLEARIRKLDKENGQLKRQLAELQRKQDPEQERLKKIHEAVQLFSVKTEIYLKDMDKYAWLLDDLQNIPEEDFKEYVRSIKVVKSWAVSMDQKVDGLMDKVG